MAKKPKPKHEPEVAKTLSKIGRPSDYSDELAGIICELISEGNSLRSICALDGMPHRATVLRWLEKEGSFRDQYARAREVQGDYMDDLILDVAMACNEENVKSTRAKIDAFKWRAARLRPKVYGDHQTIETEVQVGLSPEFLQIAERLQEIERAKRMTIEHQPREKDR